MSTAQKKYVVVRDSEEELVLLFDACIAHSAVAESTGLAVVSAGFIEPLCRQAGEDLKEGLPAQQLLHRLRLH